MIKLDHNMEHKEKQIGCIADCRVSSPKQGQQGESLEDQENIITRIANDRGWDLLRVWKSSSTAHKGKRPVFEEILTFIRANPGKIKYYLFRSIDRFTRSGAV